MCVQRLWWKYFIILKRLHLWLCLVVGYCRSLIRAIGVLYFLDSSNDLPTLNTELVFWMMDNTVCALHDHVCWYSITKPNVKLSLSLNCKPVCRRRRSFQIWIYFALNIIVALKNYLGDLQYLATAIGRLSYGYLDLGSCDLRFTHKAYIFLISQILEEM